MGGLNYFYRRSSLQKIQPPVFIPGCHLLGYMSICDQCCKILDPAYLIPGNGVQLSRVYQCNNTAGGADQLAFDADLFWIGNGHAVFRMNSIDSHKAQVRVVSGSLGGGNLPTVVMESFNRLPPKIMTRICSFREHTWAML